MASGQQVSSATEFCNQHGVDVARALLPADPGSPTRSGAGDIDAVEDSLAGDDIKIQLTSVRANR